MKRIIIKINGFLKGLILILKPHVFFYWLRHPLVTISNILNLSRWIANQDRGNILNDFYTLRRNYERRYQLYQYVISTLDLSDEKIDYLEFGVCGGLSFKWWLAKCTNQESKFYGFDTFEGLPENWGTFHKGDMATNIPIIDDARAAFIKGLFQDTLPNFLSIVNLKNGKRKVVHFDADLFSSTLFALTNIAPYLTKGDILIFDEFNVPNHEFLAFKIFSDSFYIKTKLFGAVNNYLQVALIIQ